MNLRQHKRPRPIKTLVQPKLPQIPHLLLMRVRQPSMQGDLDPALDDVDEAEAGVGSVAIATLQLMGHAGETVLRLEKVGAGNSRGKSGFLIAASLRCCRRIGNGV